MQRIEYTVSNTYCCKSYTYSTIAKRSLKDINSTLYLMITGYLLRFTSLQTDATRPYVRYESTSRSNRNREKYRLYRLLSIAITNCEISSLAL